MITCYTKINPCLIADCICSVHCCNSVCSVQEINNVVLYPPSTLLSDELHAAARCRNMVHYPCVWKPHTANTSPHDIPPLVSAPFVPSLHSYCFLENFYSFLVLHMKWAVCMSFSIWLVQQVNPESQIRAQTGVWVKPDPPSVGGGAAKSN